MIRSRHWTWTLMALLAVAATVSAAQGDKGKEGRSAKDDARARPKLSVRAQPSVTTAPGRVMLTAELRGGADDFEEYYCPMVQWEWGDDTISESSEDCAPYEEGTSVMKRRYIVQHLFRRQGSYKVYFRLIRNGRELAAASAGVEVQQGPNDFAE